VTVSVLMPGPVLTERLAATFEALSQNPTDPVLRATIPETAERILRERFISPDQCAAMALKGLKKGLFFIPTQAYIKEDVDARYREVSDAFTALGLA
jgi:short-subunit dehydrogenase